MFEDVNFQFFEKLEQTDKNFKIYYSTSEDFYKINEYLVVYICPINNHYLYFKRYNDLTEEGIPDKYYLISKDYSKKCYC